MVQKCSNIMIKHVWAFWFHTSFEGCFIVYCLFINHNSNSLDKKHKKAHIIEVHNPLGCDNMQFGRMVPTFQRNPPPSIIRIED